MAAPSGLEGSRASRLVIVIVPTSLTGSRISCQNAERQQQPATQQCADFSHLGEVCGKDLIDMQRWFGRVAPHGSTEA